MPLLWHTIVFLNLFISIASLYQTNARFPSMTKPPLSRNGNGDDQPIKERIQRIKLWLDTVPKSHIVRISHNQQTLKNIAEQLRAIQMSASTRDKLLYNKKSNEQILMQLLKQLRLIDPLELFIKERLKQFEKQHR